MPAAREACCPGLSSSNGPRRADCSPTAPPRRQMLKLSPHEQLALAFGFENLNPPDTIALE